MASAAISAQGSKVYIGSGTSGAKTITDITVGYPTILTCSSHGLVNGDVVTLASFAGADAATLNGVTVTVLYKTTNTFAVAIDTTGKTITDNTNTATATPETWTQITEVKSFSGFDGKASELDTTNLDSSAKEFILGLVDYGSFRMDINVKHSDAGQLACHNALAAGTAKPFKVTLPNSEVGTFTALVTGMPESGSSNAIYGGSIELKITGSVTWA